MRIPGTPLKSKKTRIEIYSSFFGVYTKTVLKSKKTRIEIVLQELQDGVSFPC